jgi:hypothetical protein
VRLRDFLGAPDSSQPRDPSQAPVQHSSSGPSWLPDLTFPSRRVSGLLVLLFFGFGWVLGDLSGSRPSGTLAADVAPQHLELMLPPNAPAATQTAATGAPPSTLPATPTPSAGGRESAAASTESTTTSTKTTSTSSSQSAQSSPSGSETGGESGGGKTPASASRLPPIKHVFLIVLADQPYAALFGPSSKAHYLADTLVRRGELMVRYYAVAHDELANGIAMISGQGPTAATASNCPTYADIAPVSVGADQQVLGQGCVYPSSTETLAAQLAAKHLTWKAYLEGMAGSSGQPAACLHPTVGSADPTVGPAPAPALSPGATAGAAGGTSPSQPAAGATYTTLRNPFMYFHSVTDGSGCANDDVGLGQLATDLSSEQRTPSFAYIVPSLCDDGRSTPCAPGHAAGPAATEPFLSKVVPEILASKAYKDGGLLVITADQAPATGPEADSSSCCGQPRFPALPAPAPLPGGGQLPPSGGGQVGALLLSPFVKPGTLNQDPYNHFALLRTIEDLFGLGHLGYAAASGVSSFGPSVFSASGGN